VALNQRDDVGVVGSGEKVSFPVTWHRAVLGFGRPLADRDGIYDLAKRLR
jgi:hypothetical protein